MPRGVPNKPKTDEDPQTANAEANGDSHGTMVAHLVHQFRSEDDCEECAAHVTEWQDNPAKDLTAYTAAVARAREIVNG